MHIAFSTSFDSIRLQPKIKRLQCNSPRNRTGIRLRCTGSPAAGLFTGKRNGKEQNLESVGPAVARTGMDERAPIYLDDPWTRSHGGPFVKEALRPRQDKVSDGLQNWKVQHLAEASKMIREQDISGPTSISHTPYRNVPVIGWANYSQLGKFWKSLLALMGGSRKIRGTISIDPSRCLALYWRRYGRNGPKSHLSLLAGCYTLEKLAGGHAEKSGRDKSRKSLWWMCSKIGRVIPNPLGGGPSIIFRPFAAPEVTPEKLAGGCAVKSDSDSDTGKACWRMYSKIKRVIPVWEYDPI
ncbi:hypothetical protein C8J57DRAFT_1249435 [Mycena rebaudengoi]|nr:hypothetical protein C8J57DRAFT_1249435 [Mycena rebaudengoi]